MKVNYWQNPQVLGHWILICSLNELLLQRFLFDGQSERLSIQDPGRDVIPGRFVDDIPGRRVEEDPENGVPENEYIVVLF